MVNICLDGNYIFHKTFGIFGGYGQVDPSKILSSINEQSSFVRKISTDLCASLKLLPSGGRLIFTSDSRSWRRNVEIIDGGYKSGRIRDENVDWSIFFDLIQSFGNHLEKMGFVFSKVEGAEGDDLLMFWSEHFLNSGENCLIISGDKDLHQLIRMKNNNWVCTWNSNLKNNILYVPEGWSHSWLEEDKEISIFNMGNTISPEREKFKDFLKKVDLVEINRRYFILNKILVGDKGDSVPSVWETQNSGKISKFTPKKAESFMESFMESDWANLDFRLLLEDQQFLSWASGLILRLSKDVDSSSNREKVKNNLLRNFTLMWLDQSVIPPDLRKLCNNEIDRGSAKPKKNVTLDRIKILEGSIWINSNIQPKEVDPFAFFTNQK